MIDLSTPRNLYDVSHIVNNCKYDRTWLTYPNNIKIETIENKYIEYLNNYFKINKDIKINTDNKINRDNFILTNNILHIIDKYYSIFKYSNLCKESPLLILEKPCYYNFIKIAKAYNLEIKYVDMQDDGIILEHLENILEKNSNRNVLLNIVPYYHNPTNIHYSKKKIQKLISLNEKYPKLTILSDEIYGFLSKDYYPLALLENSKIISLGSFSKIISSSLRTGWIIYNNNNNKNHYLIEAYKKTNLSNCHFDIQLNYEILERSDLNCIVNKINSKCLDSYNYVNSTLKDYLELKNQGFFIWGKIRNNKIKAKKLIEKCREKELYLYSHEIFVSDGEKSNFNHIRIISNYDFNQFKRGIKILKNVFKELSN